jgi:cystathionine beta-synthase
MGTGGTISGTAQYLKEQNPDIKVIGVDSVGSVYTSYFKTGEFDKTQIAPYLTEGIGEDIIPANIDFDYVDEVVQCNDQQAFETTRALARTEGLFIGGSCGAAVWGALEYARNANLSEDDIMVVILPDSGTRYVSKIYNDEWMIRNGFMTSPNAYTARSVVEMKQQHEELPGGSSGFITAEESETLADVIAKMNGLGISQLPVQKGDEFTGSISDTAILSKLIEDRAAGSMKVSEIMDAPFPVVEHSAKVEEISSMLTRKNPAVLVKLDEGRYNIITRSDLLALLSAKG